MNLDDGLDFIRNGDEYTDCFPDDDLCRKCCATLGEHSYFAFEHEQPRGAPMTDRIFTWLDGVGYPRERWSEDFAKVQRVVDIHHDYCAALKEVETEALDRDDVVLVAPARLFELARSAKDLRTIARWELWETTGEEQPLPPGRLESLVYGDPDNG